MSVILESIIPADVPLSSHKEYIDNYAAITQNSGRLMLFACDQKIEHLNRDFFGPAIHPDASRPEHLFALAEGGTIGAFATHLGLVARYGRKYPGINYLIKLNGKTDLISTKQQDPFSTQLWTVDDVITFKKNSALSICAVGYTIYLGSAHEQEMLKQAAALIYQAHQHGLIVVLWIYPRGEAIADDQDPALVAGATGIAACLGADFVKIKAPKKVADLMQATLAAGNTKVICSGGELKDPAFFLQELYDQLHIGGTSGSATGRNIFQKSLPEAIAFTKAISALVCHNATVEQALALYHKR